MNERFLTWALFAIRQQGTAAAESLAEIVSINKAQ